MVLLISLIVGFHDYSFARTDSQGIEWEYLRSITFIIDTEKESTTSEFYSLTHDVFLLNEQYRTEFVVRVRSLLDISIYLDNTEPPLGGTWSQVNIVAHSSERGLTIPIDDSNGGIADFKSLKYISASKPEIRHIDSSTVMTVWACGLGKYTDYLLALKHFFKGREGSPIVRSPRLNTHFIRDLNTGKASVFFAEEHYLYSSRKVGDKLAKEFNLLYGTKINWLKALNNNETIVGSENFSEQRDMLVKIVVERALLEEYRTLDELVSTVNLQDFPLTTIKLNVKQFKWSIEDHLKPENITLVGRTRKISVLVPKDLITSEWGST